MPDGTPRVALVTGAGRRVGGALADALAADGFRVAAHYHTSAAGAEAFVARHGSAHAALRADLGDAAQAAALPDRVARQFGRLDVLVNSAAIMLRQPVGTVTVEAWDRVHALNLRAPFLLTQAAAPLLREARGSVVNVADVSGLDPWPSYLPHSAAKAGLLALTRGLAQALAPEVRVNAIVPGAVLPPDGSSPEALAHAADRALLRRLGAPDDVAGALRYLLGAAFVTGSVLVVDGGALARAASDG